MTASCQSEVISTQFLLHNIDPLIDCTEIAEELDFAGVKALEVRRFLRQGSTSTISVLVTKLGHSLPSDIGLWYQFHRISLFVDKLCQYTNCIKFTHNSSAFKSARICASILIKVLALVTPFFMRIAKEFMQLLTSHDPLYRES